VLESVNAIETPSARVWARSDGIVIIQFNEGVHVEEKDNVEVQIARASLSSNNEKQRILVDTRPIKSSASNAWKIFETADNVENTKVIAFLSNRPVERHLLSFYFAEDPNAMYQTRLFTSLPKAEEWLQLFARIDI
jgi:hypothetical protein